MIETSLTKENIAEISSRTLGSYAKRTVTTVVSSNEVDAKDNRIQPSIYALAVKGRNEVNHELQGSTRDELRASLKFSLQKMPNSNFVDIDYIVNLVHDLDFEGLLYLRNVVEELIKK